MIHRIQEFRSSNLIGVFDLFFYPNFNAAGTKNIKTQKTCRQHSRPESKLRTMTLRCHISQNNPVSIYIFISPKIKQQRRRQMKNQRNPLPQPRRQLRSHKLLHHVKDHRTLILGGFNIYFIFRGSSGKLVQWGFTPS